MGRYACCAEVVMGWTCRTQAVNDLAVEGYHMEKSRMEKIGFADGRVAAKAPLAQAFDEVGALHQHLQ